MTDKTTIPMPAPLCRLCMGDDPKLRKYKDGTADLICDRCWQPETTRRRAPIPEGGLKTNEQEARWLADTIELRTEEAFAKLGLSVSSKSVDDSLYKLLLLSLESATRRGRKAA